jgi:hypothetical protein
LPCPRLGRAEHLVAAALQGAEADDLDVRDLPLAPPEVVATIRRQRVKAETMEIASRCIGMEELASAVDDSASAAW